MNAHILAAALFTTCLVGTDLCAPRVASAGLFQQDFSKNPPAVDASDLAPYRKAGFGTIKGHLTLPGIGFGQEIVLSDEPVYAVPVTDYTRWYFMNYLTKSFKVAAFPFVNGDPRRSVLKVDDQTFKTIRKATTDNDGHFEFDKLPTGKYFLVSLPNIVITGTVVTSGFLGTNATDYRNRQVVFMGDEPGYDIDGDRANPTHLVRIGLHERSRMNCIDSGHHGVDCQKAFDFDQFWGEQSEF